MKTETEIRAEIERLHLTKSSTSTSTSNDALHHLICISQIAALEWVLADTKPQETPNGGR